MRTPSRAPRWSVPGVGVVRPSVDRVTIVSATSVGGLKTRLPIDALERASHSFNPIRFRRPHPRLRSVINLTCAQSVAPLLTLKKNEAALGRYSLVTVELTYDAPATSSDVREKLNALVRLLSKNRHQRGFLRSEHQPDRTPPPGLVSLPTYYFEDRKGGVALKLYARREKHPRGRFGELIVRLEWTLKGKPALARHLGGNQIAHLLNADLNAFLKRNLRLEEIDYGAFGNLFPWTRFPTQHGSRTAPPVGVMQSIRAQWRDNRCRAKRAAFLVLRRLAHQEYEQSKFASWEQALRVCQESPAQIRGYLRELRDGKRQRRGRPKSTPRTIRGAITDYRINRCFRTVKLKPV